MKAEMNCSDFVVDVSFGSVVVLVSCWFTFVSGVEKMKSFMCELRYQEFYVKQMCFSQAQCIVGYSIARSGVCCKLHIF